MNYEDNVNRRLFELSETIRLMVSSKSKRKVIGNVTKKKSCDIEEFSAEMAEKYPDQVTKGRLLNEESDSNSIISLRDIENGDPVEFIANLAERLVEISALGKVRVAVDVIEPDLYLDLWVTLSDPCDEELVKQAIAAQFAWL